MKLTDAPTTGILAEIKKFQAAQRRAHADRAYALADDIGSKFLAPLFAEMKRRTVYAARDITLKDVTIKAGTQGYIDAEPAAGVVKVAFQLTAKWLFHVECATDEVAA